ncbi:MAG TPA: exodeoxyribonuclease V subunit alpha, partial [Polyangia bacterium]
ALADLEQPGLDGDALYHQRLLHFEERLVGALTARLARPPRALPPAEVAAALAAVRAAPPRLGAQPVALSEEQQYAVLTALHLPLTIITGGPGTGKTSIVVTILRLLARLGTPAPAVALAAPTGKAANRLQEAVLRALAGVAQPDLWDSALAATVEARTLHRLLGYSPANDRFRHHENNRLAERVVIVDECSMIDLVLMDRLVRSVRDDAHLVLLGDAEQLPSVDAGAVFRDLLPAATAAPWPWRQLVKPTLKGRLAPADPAPADPRAAAAVRLTHSYRMDASNPAGRAILEVARAINAGRGADLIPGPGGAELVTLRSQPAELAFRGVELLADETGPQLPALLDAWFERRVAGLPDWVELVRHTYVQGPSGFGDGDRERLGRLLGHLDGQRVLCITRGDRPTGAAGVNRRLHARLREALGASGPAELDPGDLVMMQRNDYERGLFNGDQGVVLWVRDEAAGARPRPMAVFRRGQGELAAFPLDALREDLTLSFALTVHKAQGSEYDYVALVLPEEAMPLLTREVLYTAVTRARASVVIAGRPALLAAGVAQPLARSSGIAEKLGRAGGEPAR